MYLAIAYQRTVTIVVGSQALGKAMCPTLGSHPFKITISLSSAWPTLIKLLMFSRSLNGMPALFTWSMRGHVGDRNRTTKISQHASLTQLLTVKVHGYAYHDNEAARERAWRRATHNTGLMRHAAPGFEAWGLNSIAVLCNEAPLSCRAESHL
eukprot:6463588-Amphidinium_carterae.1